MISTAYKYIFIHIPKTGGTSIESLLRTPDCIWTSTTPFFINKQHITHPQHFTLSEVEKILPANHFESFLKFSIVRNPWDRMLSYWSMINTSPRQPTPLKGLSFKDFVCKYLRGLIPGAARDDWHVLSANKVMSAYEDVFQTEVGLAFDVADMEVMLPCLCDYLGIEEVTLPRKNVTVHKHFSEYYDNYMQYIVRELYKEDINIFGYEFS